MHGMASEPASPSFRLDIDGIRFSHGAAATTVSPVFSLWLTFVLMYIGEPRLVACECFTAKAATPPSWPASSVGEACIHIRCIA